MEGFYPIYAVAQKAFDVNWLLIASIHKQETRLLHRATTYHGLNFAGCCGGPMQFNVTNGGGESELHLGACQQLLQLRQRARHL